MWLRLEDGQDLAEYAVLLGIVAVLVVAVVIAFGDEINRVFGLAAAALSDMVSL